MNKNWRFSELKKIGLLGLGFMGSTHSEVYKILCAQMDICVFGVCDQKQENALHASRVHGAKLYRTAEEMIEDPEIDVIDICLPTYLHFSYAKLAMEAGKDVFIEKPVVLSVEEGTKLLALQKKNGCRVMVGQCIRLWPSYVYLKETIDSGKYGPLKSLVLKRVSPRPSWGFENWYQDRNKSGGSVLDLQIHDLDFMRYLFGEPENFYAAGTIDHAFGLFLYPDGLTVQIEGGWDFPPSFPVSMEYRANFTQAAIDFQGGTVFVYEKDGRQFSANIDSGIDCGNCFGTEVADLAGYYKELKYFYECLLNGNEIVIASLEEGVKSIQLAYKEIAKGGF